MTNPLGRCRSRLTVREIQSIWLTPRTQPKNRASNAVARFPETEIVDLTLAYENRVAPAIEDVSIETEKGEFVLVAGQSNCRRSTLAL